MTSTILVRAAKGRRVPIHTSVAAAPGGRMLFVDDSEDVELPRCSYVLRRIRRGDLVVVKPAPAAPPAPAPAAPKTEPKAEPAPAAEALKKKEG